MEGLQQLLYESSGRWCHVGVFGRSGHACCGACMVQALIWGGCMLARVGDFCVRGCGHPLIFGGGDVCVCGWWSVRTVTMMSADLAVVPASRMSTVKAQMTSRVLFGPQ